MQNILISEEWESIAAIQGAEREPLVSRFQQGTVQQAMAGGIQTPPNFNGDPYSKIALLVRQ